MADYAGCLDRVSVPAQDAIDGRPAKVTAVAKKLEKCGILGHSVAFPALL